MDQEQIGKLIKEIRTKNKLSQKDFAEKYNVTYQAVSKWENGKNIPDISILKQICSDYNLSLEELLGAKREKTNKGKKLAIIIILIITLLVIILFMINKEPNDTFVFKALSSTNSDFKLMGSIAYNKDKTSIYISSVVYTGKDKESKYKEIKSTLYEINDKTKKEISKYGTSLEQGTLSEYVASMTFHADDHASICKEYTQESLLLEILAIDLADKITKYEIPIAVSDSCQK